MAPGKSTSGDTENGDRTQIHVWVEPSTKERWSEHVDESIEYSSLSGLIRTAVSREIGDIDGRPAGSNPRVEGGDVDFSPVMDRLGDLTDTVRSLDRRMDRLDSEVGDVKTSLELASEDSIDDLAQLVYAELPKSQATAESLAAGPPENGRDPSDPTGNPRELSERLNVPVSRIHDALDRLNEQMPGMIDATAAGTEPDYDHYYSG